MYLLSLYTSRAKLKKTVSKLKRDIYVEEHFAELGELTVYVLVARLVHEFAKLISDEHGDLAWVKEFVSPIPSEWADDSRVAIPMNRSMRPIFTGLYLVSRESRVMNIEVRENLANHIASSLPRIKIENFGKSLQNPPQPIGLDLREFFGRCYECLVRLHLLNRGINCDFVHRKKGKKTPDLICLDDFVLIECKDTLTELGKHGSDEDLCKKIQEVVSVAKGQLAEYDPKNKFEHIVALDLPEGVISRIQAKGQHEAEVFFRELFNAQYVDTCGTLIHREPIVEHPGNLLLSDFDFGVYAEIGDKNWPREPVWIIPPFGSLDIKTRLGCFISRFLDIQSV